MIFQKKRQNNVDPSICNPIIVNQTNQSIVVFLDRGVLYNKQVLEPGEAMGMSRKETAGSIVPYQIHALVGDERNLPSRTQSMKNLLSTAVIPTAFVVGTIAAASSAGTLAGPSAALGRAAGGVVVRGMVIDSAAIAAGSIMANRASAFAEMLIDKHPENFMVKSGRFMPGKNYIVVRGGIDVALTISKISERDFHQIPINGDVKTPTDTLQDKLKYYLPSILQSKEMKNESEMITQEANEQPSQMRTIVNEGYQQQGQQGQQGQSASESEEDRQLRLAIEASLQTEEQRKQKQQQRQQFEESGSPAVLF